MSQLLRIGIGGALGRMGRAVKKTVESREGLTVSAQFDRPGSEGESADDGTLQALETAMNLSDVIIDFSTAKGAVDLANLAAAGGRPALVIGATGLSQEDVALIEAAAARIAIVKSGNYSLGVNVLAGLVQQAAERLSALDWDIEIFEAHHRRKIDAPSGTALMLGSAAARGREIDLASNAERGRDGITGPRKPGAIGFASSRGGGIIGEHSVTFAADDEIVTFSHSARDRSLFARGAVEAALWVQNRPPGLYDMMDVLGFRG